MKFSDSKINIIKRIKYIIIKTSTDGTYSFKQYLKTSSDFGKLEEEKKITAEGVYNLHYIETDEPVILQDYHDKLASALTYFPYDLKESPPELLVIFNDIKISHRECIMNLLDANGIFYDIDNNAYRETMLKRSPNMVKNMNDFDILLICNFDGIVTEYMLDCMNKFINDKKPVIFIENNISVYRR